jgi:lipopolysaccharide transport system ATP-binding protein
MKEKEVLVKVEGLSKKFCKDLKTSLWYGMQDLFANVRGNKNERLLRDKEFWAVKDINFELRRGECLGLIGHNGAGKSTLLKILNGLINPDAGKVTIKGRVGALIELGAGFNPILSGRENIYNNGAVLGFTKKEIDSKVEDIIDFSEIREFIDMPVQNYSSGMKVRLGFAVAAQMEPDVLIIDEVLAVGDASFRAKCYEVIDSLLSKACVILVSHSMNQIVRRSNNVLLMNKGLSKLFQSPPMGVIEYEKLTVKNQRNLNSNLGNGLVELISFDFLIDDLPTKIITFNDKIKAILKLKVKKTLKKVVVDIAIRDIDESVVAEISNYVNQKFIDKIDEGSVVIETEIKNFILNPGVYKISLFVTNDSMTIHYLWMTYIFNVEVNKGVPAIAKTQFPVIWSVNQTI